MGKLKQDVCVAEGDCLLFRATRGACIVGSDCAVPARAGRRMYHCVRRAGIISFKMFVFPTRGSDTPPPREARHLPGGGGDPYAVMVNKVTLCRVADEVSLYLRWLTRQVHMKDAGIQSIPQDVPMPGGAVPRGEVCKTGEAPARGAARSAAEGRRRRPKAGDAFRGGGTRPAPLTQNLRGEYGTSPERLPAERVLPAPRAGERTLSAFLHWLRPLRPGSRNCPFPGSARGRFSALPRYNHRAPHLRKLSFSDPRGCRAIIFHDAIPARCPK